MCSQTNQNACVEDLLNIDFLKAGLKQDVLGYNRIDKGPLFTVVPSLRTEPDT
jgi:hypothetical protein